MVRFVIPQRNQGRAVARRLARIGFYPSLAEVGRYAFNKVYPRMTSGSNSMVQRASDIGKEMMRTPKKSPARSRVSSGSSVSDSDVKALTEIRKTKYGVKRLRVSGKRMKLGYPGKAAGRLRRGKRFNRRKFRNSAHKRGIVKTVETGGNLLDPFAVYVGHSSVPVKELFILVCQVVVKRMLEKFYGCQIVNMERQLSDITNGSLQIDINYYNSPVSKTMQNVGLTISSVQTFDTIGLNVANNMLQIMETDTRAEFWKIRCYNPPFDQESRHVEMNLRTLKVEAIIKSTLKIQNRTSNPSGTEADEVDNVPLHGKGYETTMGNYLQFTDQRRSTAATYSPLGGDNKTGLSTFLGSEDTTDAFLEPPQANWFTNCKYASKITLNPGEIKTSTLTYKKTFDFTKITKVVAQTNILSSNKWQHFWGKFRLFGLEKILEATPGAGVPPVAINVAYEVNTLYKVGIMEKYAPMTAQLFEKL